MILDHIYKLKATKFMDSSNSYAISVGVSDKLYSQDVDSGIGSTWGYLLKNGNAFRQVGKSYSGPALEGDIIGVLLKDSDENNFALEILRNDVNLGVMYVLPKTDYYFCYGLCERTEIQISDCYPHYIK